MEAITDPKLAAAKEAGNNIYEALRKIAKLIEDSANEEEALALWDAFTDAVDPTLGYGNRICIKDVWDVVDWFKVNCPKDQKTMRDMRNKMVKLAENKQSR